MIRALLIGLTLVAIASLVTVAWFYGYRFLVMVSEVGA